MDRHYSGGANGVNGANGDNGANGNQVVNVFKDKRVFISGGAGVIGQVLTDKLIALQARVMVGDLKPRPPHFHPAVEYRRGDLNDVTGEELEKFSPEIFFHLAATFERTTETYDFWDENFRHNINLSHHLMDCLKECRSLAAVIFASSYLIYDPALYIFPEPPASGQAVALQETSPVRPRNLCGAAKLLHEEELNFLKRFKDNGKIFKGNGQNSFQAASARIFRVYGRNSQDVISRWIRDILNGRPITVYNRAGSFDYIYADDVAEGLLRLYMSGESGIVNLGRGESRTIEEILYIIKKCIPEMEEVPGPEEAAYEASAADMTRFRAVTGWLPPTRPEEGIPEIIKHETKT